MQDYGLEIMGRHIGNSLKHLHIEACPRITEFGLKHLEVFRFVLFNNLILFGFISFSALNTLVLRDLPRVYKSERTIAALKEALPSCDIDHNLKS